MCEALDFYSAVYRRSISLSHTLCLAAAESISMKIPEKFYAVLRYGSGAEAVRVNWAKAPRVDDFMLCSAVARLKCGLQYLFSRPWYEPNFLTFNSETKIYHRVNSISKNEGNIKAPLSKPRISSNSYTLFLLLAALSVSRGNVSILSISLFIFHGIHATASALILFALPMLRSLSLSAFFISFVYTHRLRGYIIWTRRGNKKKKKMLKTSVKKESRKLVSRFFDESRRKTYWLRVRWLSYTYIISPMNGSHTLKDSKRDQLASF